MTPVSVVIVTFNSSGHIRKCLQALRDSDVPIQLIVVDNASEDDTAAVVEKELARFPGARFIASPRNVGFARGMNAGMQHATAERIVLLNPDCFVEPSTLRTMALTMAHSDDIGLSGCLLLNVDGSEQAGCRRYIPTPWRALMRVLHLKRLFKGRRRFDDFIMSNEALPQDVQDVEALSGALMMVSRPGLRAVGALDERYFMHCEDLDWCLRFRQAGWRVVFVPAARAVHLKGASTASRPLRVEYHKHVGMIKFYRRHLARRYPGPLMWAVTASVWVRFGAKAVVTLPKSLASLRRRRRAAGSDIGRRQERYGVRQQ